MTNETLSLISRHEAIVSTCDAALARISATNPMRAMIEGNRNRALAEIAYLGRSAR